MKKLIFDLYFLIVHISTNIALNYIKFWLHVHNISHEGTVSQIYFFRF